MSGTDKRREAARRQLEKKLEQRQLDDAKRRRTTLISSVVATVAVIVLVVVLIVTLGGNDNKKTPAAASGSSIAPSTPATATAPTSTAAPSYPCSWVKSGTAAKAATVPTTTTPPKTGSSVVTVKTTQGPLTFTLNRAAAPCTVASFLSLVTQKYYDNTPCHRLTTAGIYVLQCGDPLGTGRGGPGYSIPDEFLAGDKYTSGVLAMANTGAAHTGGSQFFIVYKDTSLPPQYTIFGQVTAGLSVVTKVAAAGTDNANGSGDGHPKLAIKITSMTAAA